MKRLAPVALLAVLFLGGSLLGFDAVGKILKVDSEKGVLHLNANGQDRMVPVAKDAKFLDSDGKPLADGMKAKEFAAGTTVTVTVERGDSGPTITVIRLGGKVDPAPQKSGGKNSVGFKPLNEMSATDKYKNEEGGLYGNGKSEPPAKHQASAEAETKMIVPRDSNGNPADFGTIALVSISMSNATQEFSMFKQIADKDPEKSSKVTIVDCAQGGQAMAQWVDPRARAWVEADRRLAAAKIDPKQVQVVWVKLANVGPRGELEEHVGKLQKDTTAVLHNARERFPNLKIAYLGSRIYGGYSSGSLNPEPYAYEGAFAVRNLIRDQVEGKGDLNFEAAKGPVKAPLLLWGPYLWADGVNARKDGLKYEREDLAGDGTHPSQSGREKVAQQLLKFFKTDSLAKNWFVK